MLCTFDDIRSITAGIHIAHLGMAVQLHSLSGCIVLTSAPEIGYLLNAYDIYKLQFMIKVVMLGHALNLDKVAFLDRRTHFFRQIRCKKDLKPDGIAEIGNSIFKDKVSCFLKRYLIKSYDLAADYYRSYLIHDGFYLVHLTVKAPAVDQIGIITHLKLLYIAGHTAALISLIR